MEVFTMSRLTRCLFLAVWCGVAFVLGCGGGSGKSEVHGTVQIDDQPVQEGELTFRPKEQGKVPEGARIKNGTYSVRIAPGSYTVEVHATKKVPLEPGEDTASGEKEKVVSIVPRKYEKQPVKVDIAGNEEHHIKLTSR